MLRTFVAVNLPKDVREKIGEAEKDFDIKGVKLVEPSLVHITLKFLGNVEESRVDDIEAALKKVTVKPFEAWYGSIGCFPGERNPRVIWIGAEGDFVELNRQVEALLEPLGFPKEGRFQPHATIGRVKFSTPELRQRLPAALDKYKDFKAGESNVESIHIMKSTLGPKGPVYEALKEIRL